MEPSTKGKGSRVKKRARKMMSSERGDDSESVIRVPLSHGGTADWEPHGDYDDDSDFRYNSINLWMETKALFAPIS